MSESTTPIRDSLSVLTSGVRSGRRRARPAAVVVQVAVLAIVLVATVPGSAGAQTAGRKVARGLAGMTLGFLEIPGNIVQQTRQQGPIVGATAGLGLGIGKLVARELIGVYEFVTAPFAVPDNFAPILQPEFPWQYFGPNARSNDAFNPAGYADTRSGDIDIAEIERIRGAVVTRRQGVVVVEFPAYVRFATGSAALTEDAHSRLAALAAVLKRHPGLRISVLGHTDSRGDDASNLALSAKRAEAVRAYLISQGIPSPRITSKGYGDSYPVADNSTAEGRLRNRRVEIELASAG